MTKKTQKSMTAKVNALKVYSLKKKKRTRTPSLKSRTSSISTGSNNRYQNGYFEPRYAYKKKKNELSINSYTNQGN